MKLLLKTIIKKILPPKVMSLGFSKYFQYYLFQRILRINGNVPWLVHWSSIVTSHNKITMGKSKYYPGFMPGCYTQAANGIVLQDNIYIGPGVKIISANHDVNNFKIWNRAKPIKIKSNCWIGANAVILPEVEIGEHTIVAAGAVVTKSFKEENVILAGVPAKIVKHIENYDSIS